MWGGSGDRDGLDPRIGERGIEVGLDPDPRVAAAEVFGAAFVELAEPHQAELRTLNDVTDNVRSPVAIADNQGSNCSCWIHAAPFRLRTTHGVLRRI